MIPNRQHHNSLFPYNFLGYISSKLSFIFFFDQEKIDEYILLRHKYLMEDKFAQEKLKEKEKGFF